MASSLSWQYLAGFIDGEGSIKHYKGYARITIGQKSRQVLDEIQRFLGTNNAITFSRGCYYLQYCHKGTVEYIIEGIEPYVLVKRDDIQAIRNLWDPDKRGV